jgi:PIN domain nuclease of toxin-antitoxin system
MKLLLDTHAVIWFISDSQELPIGIKEIIENPSSD